MIPTINVASFPGFLFSFFNYLHVSHSKVCRVKYIKHRQLICLKEESFLKLLLSNFSFVASIYCAIIEFVFDNEKENWEPGNETTISEYGL